MHRGGQCSSANDPHPCSIIRMHLRNAISPNCSVNAATESALGTGSYEVGTDAAVGYRLIHSGKHRRLLGQRAGWALGDGPK